MRDGKVDPIVMPESITKHGQNWKGVDYLIFNTYIWWTKYPTMKVLWVLGKFFPLLSYYTQCNIDQDLSNFLLNRWKRRGSFDEGATEYDEIDMYTVYENTLRTWGKWVEENVNPNLTFVFFSSAAPKHVRYYSKSLINQKYPTSK